LYKAIDLTNETDLNYRVSKNKRLSIELLFIRLCQLNNPLAEEDKKKILIEPIAEFSTPVKHPAVAISSIRVEYLSKDTPVNNQSAKHNIVRISLKNKEEKPERFSTLENQPHPVQAETFDLEALQTVWKQYANELTDKHFKGIMTFIIPELKENNVIEVPALNPEQMHYIQQNISQVKEYLSSQLKNDRITLEIKLKENNGEHTPFTSQEKYAYMVDKNPLLKKLVQEFSLRLD